MTTHDNTITAAFHMKAASLGQLVEAHDVKAFVLSIPALFKMGDIQATWFQSEAELAWYGLVFQPIVTGVKPSGLPVYHTGLRMRTVGAEPTMEVFDGKRLLFALDLTCTTTLDLEKATAKLVEWVAAQDPESIFCRAIVKATAAAKKLSHTQMQDIPDVIRQGSALADTLAREADMTAVADAIPRG